MTVSSRGAAVPTLAGEETGELSGCSCACSASCLEVKLRQGPSRREPAGDAPRNGSEAPRKAAPGRGRYLPEPWSAGGASRLQLPMLYCVGYGGLQRCRCESIDVHCLCGVPATACRPCKGGAVLLRPMRWISCCARSQGEGL